MRQDIDHALKGWEFKPALVQAKLVDARDGRQVIQMRVDLGVLQIEITGRPDGVRPHGYSTYYDYLRNQAAQCRRTDHQFTLSEEQCMEADREFVQYYHRRICWLALRNYERAVQDADHTLAFMTFINRHSPDEEYALAHEQYRGFVLFHRAQARAALAIERDDPERAIDDLHEGLGDLEDFFSEHDALEHMEEDGMVQHLRHVQDQIRDTHNIDATLKEKLEQAVEDENYEMAARIRDTLKSQGRRI